MEFSIKTGSAEKLRAGCVVAGVFDGGKLSPAGEELDRASGGFLASVLASGDLDGSLGRTLLLHKVKNLAAERVLLVGLGREKELSEGAFRTAALAAAKALRNTGTTEVVTTLADLALKKRDVAWKVEQVVMAFREAGYRFDRMKSKPAAPKKEVKKVTIVLARKGDANEAQAAADRADAIAQGMAFTRDLGNLPGNVCTPTYLAEQAQELARKHGLKIDVFDQKGIEKLGMGSFLAVAQGSKQPPRFIVLEHRGGKKDEAPVVLVGKGVTFDTGGISIKPAAEMDEMKFDMCGAASVLGTMLAVALMDLPINVVGAIPATENMPGGNAIKPGDIVTTMSGQTVEILNTDAEGRLILCDALTYVERYKPAAVVDIATLTGAMVISLGHVTTGLFANSDPLARELVQAGDDAWDRAWQLPLFDDYQEGLKSNFADFPNIASRAGGAITAACFLSRFTKAYAWAHLDIAGTAWKSGAEKGATGRPVALLSHFLLRRAA